MDADGGVFFGGETRLIILLKDDYQKLFAKIDLMAWMQAPSYDVVYHWRNNRSPMLERPSSMTFMGSCLNTIEFKIMSL